MTNIINIKTGKFSAMNTFNTFTLVCAKKFPDEYNEKIKQLEKDYANDEEAYESQKENANKLFESINQDKQKSTVEEFLREYYEFKRNHKFDALSTYLALIRELDNVVGEMLKSEPTATCPQFKAFCKAYLGAGVDTKDALYIANGIHDGKGYSLWWYGLTAAVFATGGFWGGKILTKK
jgi:hypothetical protein